RDTMAKPASGYRRSMLKPSLSRYQLAAAPTSAAGSSGQTLLRRAQGVFSGPPAPPASPFPPERPPVVREPHRIGPELDAPVGKNPRAGAARGQAEHVHRHRHAAGVAIADFDVTIDHHRGADKSHRSHADVVAELFELLLECRDFRIRI